MAPCNAGTVKRLDKCCGLLHLLAELRAEFLEIGVDALNEYLVVGGYNLEFLHIYLGLYNVGDSCEYVGSMTVGSRHKHLGKGLTHLQVGFLAEREHKRGEALGHVHTLFKVFVDSRGVYLGEVGQVHRLGGTGAIGEVAEEAVAEERCHGSHEL